MMVTFVVADDPTNINTASPLNLTMTRSGTTDDGQAAVLAGYEAMKANSFPSTDIQQKRVLNASDSNVYLLTYTVFLDPAPNAGGLFWANNC
jgi:hypothetical protein